MVKNILLICLCLLGLLKLHKCQQCNYEIGIDYRGVSSVIDLNYQTATSAQMCCSLCNANPACNAWTFVVQTYICWLKKSFGLKISTSGRISGVKLNIITTTTTAPTTATSGTSIPATCYIESSVVYTGNDLVILTNLTNPSDCCTSCGRLSGCVSWSYLTDYKYCYMKNALPSPSRKVNYTNSYSGVVSNTLLTTLPTTTTTTTTTVMPSTSRVSFCYIESSTFYQNNDIAGYIFPSPSDCCNACGQITGCVAWSYLTDTKYCALKNALPITANRLSITNAYSGTLIK